MRLLFASIVASTLANFASAQCPGGVCPAPVAPRPITAQQTMPSFTAVAAQGGCITPIAVQGCGPACGAGVWYPGQFIREHRPIRNFVRGLFGR